MHQSIRQRLFSVHALPLGLIAVLALFGSSAQAATGANFVATGHDMDYHCSVAGPEEIEQECKYLAIVVDKVRDGSSLPILALDQGSELPTALHNAGYTGSGEVVTVNPAESKAFDSTSFVDAEGNPAYSAIITASDETCGGCDDNEEGESNINARAEDFKTFFNAGGGILALAGAARYETYYDFVPLSVGATAVSPPFEVTLEGEALGITNSEANCCATHNSFDYPPPEPFVTLEKDTAGKAETIAVFNGTIGEEGFETPSVTTSLSGDGQSGPKITVKERAPVTDVATLSGEKAATAGGTVTYKVYKDAKCSELVTEAGTVTVADGSVPSSDPESFEMPGSYYWLASYSGDAEHAAASSECGSEVETVEGVMPPPEECKASGRGRFRVKKEIQTVADRLSTDLTARQRLKFRWNKEGKHLLDLTQLTSASCTATKHGKAFRGEGTATVNGEGGYEIVFTITVTDHDRLIFKLKVGKGHERMSFRDAARASEAISSS